MPSPRGFTAPSTPAANSGVQLFDLAAYVSAAKLGNPIAGNYFTVENGTPTVSVSVTTTSINNATLPAATATYSGPSNCHRYRDELWSQLYSHHYWRWIQGCSQGTTPLGVLVALGMVLLV
jgi:hypothetical protein